MISRDLAMIIKDMAIILMGLVNLLLIFRIINGKVAVSLQLFLILFIAIGLYYIIFICIPA